MGTVIAALAFSAATLLTAAPISAQDGPRYWWLSLITAVVGTVLAWSLAGWLEFEPGVDIARTYLTGTSVRLSAQ